MKNCNGIFYVAKIERKNNSYYGNPKYALHLRGLDGDCCVATTATNAMCAYKIGYSTENKYIQATYHYTGTGKMVITSFEYLDADVVQKLQEQLRKAHFIGNYKIVDNFCDLPQVGQKHSLTNEYVFSVELQCCDDMFAYYKVWYYTEDDFENTREHKETNCRYFGYAVRKR